MRIQLVASGTPTHFYPMAPFGWAARAAGHDVHVATTPDLVDDVAGCGLPTVAVGPAAGFAGRYRARHGGDPKDLFCALAAAMADDLVEHVRWYRPDLVVWDPSALAGPVAAAVLGVPSARYLWGPDLIGRGTSGRDRLPAAFGELFTRFGVRLDDVPPWPTIDPTPPSLRLAGPDWYPVRYLPYSPQLRVPPEVLDPPSRPRVVVAGGVSAPGLSDAVAGLPSAVLDALAAVDAELVLALPAGTTPDGPLPHGIRVVSGCPLHLLLGGADLVVHHGGGGSLLTAAWCGVPQLVVSHLPDLAFYGERLAGTGAGIHLPGAAAEPGPIAAAVARLRTDPAYARAAERLRAEVLAQPTPAELVDTLADLAAVPVGVAR
jgi:UDP:flavonoid glycosyltransferase YjiC (YdhE family)